MATRDSKLEEQRAVIQILLLEGEIPCHSFQRLQKSFSEACVYRLTFYSWISQFREDRTSVRPKSRPGRPAEAVTPTMLANVEVFVNKDRRVTLQEVANQFSIGKASAHQILHETLGVSKVKC